EKVRQAVQELRQPHGNGNVTDTLLEVDRILSESPADKFAAREVYFLTDLQRSTWVTGQPVKADLVKRIQERGRVVFVDVGQDGVPNLAVTDVRLGAPLALTGVETPVLATLANYGGPRAPPLRPPLP